MGIEGVLKKGFITTSADTVLNYMRLLFLDADKLAADNVDMVHAHLLPNRRSKSGEGGFGHSGKK